MICLRGAQLKSKSTRHRLLIGLHATQYLSGWFATGSIAVMTRSLGHLACAALLSSLSAS